VSTVESSLEVERQAEKLVFDDARLQHRLAYLSPVELRTVAQAQRKLSESVSAAGLHFEGKPYPVSLRPLPISGETANNLAGIVERFVKLFDTVAHLYCLHTEVRELFPAYRNMERYTVALPKLTPLVRVCRLDGLFKPDGRYQILETNTDCPGGVIQNGLAGKIWEHAKSDNSLVADMALTATTQPFVVDPDLFLKELLAAHLERTGTEPQSAAIVTFKGRFTNEVERMVDGLNRLGVDAWTVDASELRQSAGRLVDGRGRRIDVAYNKLDLRDLIDEPLVDDYLKAAADGDVTFLNPLICQWPLADKAILALLSDPQYDSLFSVEERELCMRHVPWTRLLRADVTTIDPTGSRSELLPYVMNHRAGLVLKPTNATRGKGVVIGATVDQATWEQALSIALNDEPHVVQEYIEAPQLNAPHPATGEIQQMAAGIDIYAFGGRFAGFQARASLDPVMNVGKRGILLPVTTFPE
jgi:glutathionylspermidine synthase